MANPEHVALLQQGVAKWNAWRLKDPATQPDLCQASFRRKDLFRTLSDGTRTPAPEGRADLQGANLFESLLIDADLTDGDLAGANLAQADLDGANLSQADLTGANLRGTFLGNTTFEEAILCGVDLREAELIGTDLSYATLDGVDLTGMDLSFASLVGSSLIEVNLNGADLTGADLTGADLTEANLTEANLTRANLIETDLNHADLTGCRVYGASVWNVNLAGTIQKNLVITPPHESVIQIDDLEIAQFLYLLLNNAKIRQVIDTITSKVVLILGRFTEERKEVLDALRAALRERDYLPVLFDFEKPLNRDITETVSTLAHIARFVIADITDAKSISQELSFIVPHLPSVPVQPLLLSSQREYGMFEHFRSYPWVLPMVLYESQNELLGSLEQKVILPAEIKIKELRAKVYHL